MISRTFPLLQHYKYRDFKSIYIDLTVKITLNCIFVFFKIVYPIIWPQMGKKQVAMLNSDFSLSLIIAV